MLINKNDFVKLINIVAKQNETVKKLYDLGVDLIEFDILSGQTIKLLDLMTNDDEWVGYFCWELDFGKKYHEGSVTKYDVPIDISTPEKLYEMLERDEQNGKVNKD
jgi:hypothetical protein